MHIVVDARKAFDSGIGTYIRGVVPGVIARLPDHEFTVLTRLGMQPFMSVDRHGIRHLQIADAPFSLGEQWSLRRLPRVDAFWATSLAHSLFGRTPIVATIHDVVQLSLRGDEGSSPMVRAAVRLLALSLRRRARLLLFNSQTTRMEFERTIGRGRGAQIVTPLGVASDWFDGTRTPRPAQAPYLICVTSWRTHKNLPFLLHAFAGIRERIPHELVVVGADPGDAPASIPDLGPRVRWLTAVSEPMLRTLVRDADAMVLPSLHEGFGLPALEAMASGCPVVAARIEAFVEVCGDAARYFDPRDPTSLAEALLEQASLDPSWLATRRRLGIERARGFTWDRTVDATAQAIAGF